jgi:hypothetical protein
MRTNLLICLTVLTIGLAVGCASTSGNADGGTGGTSGTGGATGTGGHGGTGGGGAGGGSASGCVPACGPGNVCVGSGTEGGAIIVPNDAGVCPTGTHPAGGTPTTCQNDLSYACKPLPSGCNGTLTCACATAICSDPICQVVSATELTCIQAVP